MDWRESAVAMIVTTGAAAAAWRLRALTSSGACAAAMLGAALAAFGGWRWLLVVGAFFATSSALTRWTPRSPDARRSGDIRGRAWDQVLANGGVAGLAAIAYRLTGAEVFFIAAAGSIAAATADTWATEAGRWSRMWPRLITTRRPVPHGTSGGITPTGTAAAAVGALLIGLVAASMAAKTPAGRTAVAVSASGFAAAVLDSALGATVEARWRAAGNSAINLAATASGALLSALAAILWS